jgi:hypothetical protein
VALSGGNKGVWRALRYRLAIVSPIYKMVLRFGYGVHGNGRSARDIQVLAGSRSPFGIILRCGNVDVSFHEVSHKGKVFIYSNRKRWVCGNERVFVVSPLNKVVAVFGNGNNGGFLPYGYLSASQQRAGSRGNINQGNSVGNRYEVSDETQRFFYLKWVNGV